MTEGQAPRSRARTRRRELSRLSLVAVLLTLLVSAGPGSASAAPAWKSRVVPLVDCYAQNADGSYTFILAYDSSYTTTQTIPRGSNNYATPSTYTSQLPTVFQPGEQHGAAKLVVSAADYASGTVSWYVDGSTLNTRTAGTVPLCTAAQLPAFANGAALVVLLLVAGAIGVLMVRRVRRRLTAAVS